MNEYYKNGSIVYANSEMFVYFEGEKAIIPSKMQVGNKTVNITTLETIYEERSDGPMEFIEIPFGAFQEHEFEKAEVSEGIRTIEENCFGYCKNLKEIKLPNSLREIGDIVFQDCKKLEKVNIPINVEDIGEQIFKNCTSLREITWDSKLKLDKDMMKSIFVNCPNLERIIYHGTVVDVNPPTLDELLKKAYNPGKVSEPSQNQISVPNVFKKPEESR